MSVGRVVESSECSTNAPRYIGAVCQHDGRARCGIFGKAPARELENHIDVVGRFAVAQLHAAAVCRRTGDVPHARRDVARDGVHAHDGDSIALDTLAARAKPVRSSASTTGGLPSHTWRSR